MQCSEHQTCFAAYAPDQPLTWALALAPDPPPTYNSPHQVLDAYNVQELGPGDAGTLPASRVKFVEVQDGFFEEKKEADNAKRPG